MNTEEELNAIFGNWRDDSKLYTRAELYALIKIKNPNISINPWLPSDFCYNRCNKGIKSLFKTRTHLFEYCGRNSYKILGKDFPYNGDIVQGGTTVGKWSNGKIVTLI